MSIPSRRRRRPQPQPQQQTQQSQPRPAVLLCVTVAALLAQAATAFLPPAQPAQQQHPRGIALAATAATKAAAGSGPGPSSPTAGVGFGKAAQAALVGKSFRDELITLMTVPKEIGAAEDGGPAASVAQRIEFVVDRLAETYVPPQTLPFMNLLLEGTWINAYNSWALRRQVLAAQKAARAAAMQAAMDEMLAFVDDDELPAAVKAKQQAQAQADMEDEDDEEGEEPGVPRAGVELRAFEQRLAPNVTTGSVENTVRWACTEGADAGLVGALVVRSGYEVNSRGILELTEPEHDLRLTKGPRQPEALVRAIQRAVPFDAFDPNATFVETAFMDHEVRATKTHSTRFGTVINLYVRNGTDLHRRLQQEGHLRVSPA